MGYVDEVLARLGRRRLFDCRDDEMETSSELLVGGVVP